MRPPSWTGCIDRDRDPLPEPLSFLFPTAWGATGAGGAGSKGEEGISGRLHKCMGILWEGTCCFSRAEAATVEALAREEVSEAFSS
jgi:hypothetical protein